MPVTVRPASHAARKWTRDNRSLSAEGLLRDACAKQYKTCETVLNSSFSDFDSQSPIFPSSNGFVRSVLAAYNQHHHLTLRPEDIWFAILTQLSLYINEHAEELRSFFVAHEGQKALWIVADGKPASWDFGFIAQKMSKLMSKNVVDPDLHGWIMPAFTTTTETDTTVAAILMMGAFQKYFGYGAMTRCGIPSITLLGVKEDWQLILDRLERIPLLGNEPTQFYSLLKPVLTRIVNSFDAPASEDTIDFWSKITHQSGGSGIPWISGWLTAFCFWDNKGKSMYNPPADVDSGRWSVGKQGLSLDHTIYHRVDPSKISDGFSSVPLKIDDDGHIYETTMVAGSVGIRVSTSGEPLDVSRQIYNRDRRVYETFSSLHRETGFDSVQPESGWWIFENIAEPNKTSREGIYADKHADFPASMKTGLEGNKPLLGDRLDKII